VTAYPFAYLRRWGFKVGSLNVCWRDMWTGARGLEVAWSERAVSVGFKREAP
jgi:hypothetical protein